MEFPGKGHQWGHLRGQSGETKNEVDTSGKNISGRGKRKCKSAPVGSCPQGGRNKRAGVAGRE